MALRAGGGLAVAAGSEVKKNVAPAWKARLTRNRLGLDMERHLPGGMRSVWKRDKLERPLTYEIWSTTQASQCKVELAPRLELTCVCMSTHLGGHEDND